MINSSDALYPNVVFFKTVFDPYCFYTSALIVYLICTCDLPCCTHFLHTLLWYKFSHGFIDPVSLLLTMNYLTGREENLSITTFLSKVS